MLISSPHNLTTREPDAWPPPPELLSYTSAKQITICPRQWALRHAFYPGLWEEDGYPPAIYMAAVEGSIVHRTLERILGALSGQGCSSVRDPAAIAVLKDLGGFTHVVQVYTEEVLSSYKGNPRVQHAFSAFSRHIHSRQAALRERVQLMLSQVQLVEQQDSSHSYKIPEATFSPSPGPLPLGTRSEVRLVASQIGWKGYADLINLTEETCEIIDFKTGAPRDEHAEQLCLYSVLWLHDTQRNPKGRPATKLTLCYQGRTQDVPVPSPEESASLASALKTQVQTVQELVSQDPPEARPSPEVCPHCDVRHLCPRYWTTTVQERILQAETNLSNFIDVELRITKKQSPTCYSARVERPCALTRGTPVVFLTGGRPVSLSRHMVVRILGAHRSGGDEGHDATPLTLSLTKGSEFFVVPTQPPRRKI